MTIDAVRFEVDVPQEVLDDLRRRLRATRWPIEPDTAPWQYGVPLDYMRRVVEYWIESYEWRASERAINAFDNFTASIESLDVHYILAHGSGQRPRPLIITHGWPGSIVEFLAVIEPLTHPERFGGDQADAFTVVVPSIPGFGFSQAPPRPIGPRDVARMWNTLMTETLGFDRYLAQGGDWGSIITSWMAHDYPDHLAAMHLNLLAFDQVPESGEFEAEELDYLQRMSVRRDPEAGYRILNTTRPQSVAFGLTDSPAGLAAWILEKFHGWTVPGDDRDPPFELDHLLANVMLYWLQGPAAASWMYVSLADVGTRRLPQGERLTVPTAFLFCPRDVSLPPPNSVITRTYNLHRRTEAPGGGHFVAFEQPDLFVTDVREALRGY